MWLWFGFGEGVLETEFFLVGSGWPHFFAVGGGRKLEGFF